MQSPEPLLPETMEFREDEGAGAVTGTFHRLTMPVYLNHPAFVPNPSEFDWDIDPKWDLMVVVESEYGWEEYSDWEDEGWYAIGALEPAMEPEDLPDGSG